MSPRDTTGWGALVGAMPSMIGALFELLDCEDSMGRAAPRGLPRWGRGWDRPSSKHDEDPSPKPETDFGRPVARGCEEL